ncbi:hypothetical protein ACC810_02925 [Rhizobium ruizarguesonis]
MANNEIRNEINLILSSERAELREQAIDEVERANSLPIQERHSGALQRSETEIGIAATATGRRRVLLSALGLIGTGVSVAGGAFGILSFFRDRADSESEEFRISREFATHIAGVDYNHPNPRDSYTAEILSLGEQAVIDSMDKLRERKFNELFDIHRSLEKAVDNSPDPHGQAIALTRLAIDRSFMGDGATAVAALKRMDFRGIHDSKITTRCVDFGTSVSLNALNSKEFASLSSESLETMEMGWSKLGVTTDVPAEIAALAPRFGVGVFAIAQRAGIRPVIKNNGSRSISALREDWFHTIRATMYFLPKENRDFTTDFLFALHRPTFHASAAGDHGQARFMLDYYFGRSRPNHLHETSIDESRNLIAATAPGSSPWMFLLDMAYNPENVEQRFEFLVSKSQNQSLHVKKSLIEMARRLKYDEAAVAKNLGVSITRRELSEIGMHQSSIDTIFQESFG